jgi:protein-tyrosine phosphatase
MIDIHTHILPGIDDGPRTLEESLDVARSAVQNDVQIAIATPHTLNGVDHNPREAILQACDTLNNALKARAVPLEVLPGAEVHMSPEIIEELEAGRLMTLNDAGRHICLELTEPVAPEAVFTLIGQLKRMGVTAIITHPEKSFAIQRDINLARAFAAAGALFQIAAGSLTGSFGKPVYKAAVEMIREQLVHFMASDAHSISVRSYHMGKAGRKLRALAGDGIFERIMVHHPESVVKGKNVDVSFQPPM